MQDPAKSDYCPRCKRASALRHTGLQIDPSDVNVERADLEALRAGLAGSVPAPGLGGSAEPEPRTLAGEGIPDPVRNLFEEGGRAEAANAPRAAAAMYRAAVEAICDALNMPRNERTSNDRDRRLSLQERLDRLAAKGVAADVVSDLHEARLVGNDSIHDGLIYAEDELADVAELITEAAHLLFVQPAERSVILARLYHRQFYRVGQAVLLTSDCADPYDQRWTTSRGESTDYEWKAILRTVRIPRPAQAG